MIKKLLSLVQVKVVLENQLYQLILAIRLQIFKNLKVGLLDADIYGPSIPKMLGITENLLPQKIKKCSPMKNLD